MVVEKETGQQINKSLQRLPQIEIIRMDKVNRTERLSQAMKKMGEDQAEIVAMLEFDWPGADQIIDALCNFVTESIQEDGSPVIYRIVDKALESYGKAVFRPDGKKLEDPLRIAIFLDRLLSESAIELNIWIEDDRGSAWNVDSEIPFSDWLEQHPGDVAVYQRAGADHLMLRKRLYALLTCSPIKRVMKRTGYESAVVDGRLAINR